MIEGVDGAFVRGSAHDAEGQELVGEKRRHARDARALEPGAVVRLVRARDQAIEVDPRLAVGEAEQDQVALHREPDGDLVEDRRVGPEHESERGGVGLVGVEPLAVDAPGVSRDRAAWRNSRLKSISTPVTQGLLGSETITSKVPALRSSAREAAATSVPTLRLRH